MGKLLKLFLLLLVLSLLFSPVGFAKSDQAKQHLLGLGDSIPYGYNLGETNDKPSKYGFPYLIGQEANLKVRNLSVPGWKSDQMLHALKTDQKYRQAVRHSDYITLTIGNNDLLQALGQAQGKSNGDVLLFVALLQEEIANSSILTNINEMTSEIRSLTDAPIVIYNVYNPFQQGNPLHVLADQTILPGVNQQISELQQQLNAQFGDVLLADAFKAFGTNQAQFVIVGDIHPTVAGQEKLAEIGLTRLGLR